MCERYDYPAEIKRTADGRHVLAFPDFGRGAVDGATRTEALAGAGDLLGELIAAAMREGRDLPEPSRARRGQCVVVPPLAIAVKAAFYAAFRESGLTQRAMGDVLGVAEGEVRRMLNPDHGTGTARMDRCLRKLGRRVRVTVDRGA